MLDTMFGLPVHPLVVHATVVLVPLAALLVCVAALWRQMRVPLGWPAALVSVLATASVALAALSGGPLARRVGSSALIAQHAQFAKLLAVWVVAMTVTSTGLAYVAWRRAGAPVAPGLRVPRRIVELVTPRSLAPLVATRWIMPVVVGLSLLTAAGTLTQVVLVGHTGARAAWSQVVRSPAPHQHAGGR
jgi:hypothetical protein